MKCFKAGEEIKPKKNVLYKIKCEEEDMCCCKNKSQGLKIDKRQHGHQTFRNKTNYSKFHFAWVFNMLEKFVCHLASSQF